MATGWRAVPIWECRELKDRIAMLHFKPPDNYRMYKLLNVTNDYMDCFLDFRVHLLIAFMDA